MYPFCFCDSHDVTAVIHAIHLYVRMTINSLAHNSSSEKCELFSHRPVSVLPRLPQPVDGVTLKGGHDGVQRGEILSGSALLLKAQRQMNTVA